MKYDLSIRPTNIQPHIDIERDIQEKGDGLFTFNLRINEGSIVDYVQYQTITYELYAGIAVTTVEEPVTSRDSGDGGDITAIRPTVNQRSHTERDSGSVDA